MQKNDLIYIDDRIYRVLELKEHKAFVIDCLSRTVPKWIDVDDNLKYKQCSEEKLFEITDITPVNIDELDALSRKIAYERYTLIAGILSFVFDEEDRRYMTRKISEQRGISMQTIKKYLLLYLVYQNISVLAPKAKVHKRKLTKDEKNFRWALNKFFYTKRNNSLKTAYTFMIKEKYCDEHGNLLENYPTINQFKYFYRKNNSLEKFYISRDGLKSYQRNNRPLLGDGIREYAPNVGYGMFDSTICDIYLVNDSGNLVGRPILTACIDAYSGLCLGYTLSWEGGVYSLRKLLLNIISDKVIHCKNYGINIEVSEWDCSGILPGVFITDKGKEYESENFEQITELGVTLINLPAYRPELKGAVEKFFDVVQNLFKPHLKGKGVIEPDFQERGSHDYRKDACLTMSDFEKILLYCIIYYNSQKVIENFPYSEQMISDNVKPYSNSIWNYSINQQGANVIPVTKKQLVLTLLPRTIGKFTRKGLVVNKYRYKRDGYTEQYLSGGSVNVSYNPEDISSVWLIENGEYIVFDLIETRFEGKSLDESDSILKRQKQILNSVKKDNLKAQIDLIEHIKVISENKAVVNNVGMKKVRNTRQKEQNIYHYDFARGVDLNE